VVPTHERLALVAPQIEIIARRGLRSAMGDGWCLRCMRRLGLNESDMDCLNEFTCGEVKDLIARTIIAVANEHAA
jgi:hypothetical protein